jgi:hypothetical protein
MPAHPSSVGGGAGSSAAASGTPSGVGSAPPAGGRLGIAVAPAGADVVRTAALAVRVKSVAALERDVVTVASLAAQAGGYVQSSDVSTDSKATATVTVRVPGSALPATMAAAATLGRVMSSTEQGADVTGQVVDLAAEQQNLQSEAAAVRGILDRATSLSDILTIQQQLFTLQGEIAQIQSQRNLLANQVQYASLALTLWAASPAKSTPHPGLLSRFVHLAYTHTVAAVRGVVLAVGWSAPGLLLLMAAAAAYLLYRRRRLAGSPVASPGGSTAER